jgi:dolichol-phosphate mannosyltransferase
MEREMTVSIVVPFYNEQECMEETYRRLTAVMESTGERYELIFVNDGSRDLSPGIVEQLCEQDPRVRLIDLSRNFGHQIAVTAGLNHTSGQAVVIIDADLQDPPEVILEMIDLWRQGYEVVYGRRLSRQGETGFKKLSAKVFYRLLNALTNVDIPLDTGDFRLIDRKVCDVLNRMSERNRYIRGLVSWAGFKQTAVEYERDRRFAGVTKYPLRRMVRFALDAVTSFSHKPLRLASYFGFALSAVSFVYLLIVLYEKLFTDWTVAGWSSIVAMNLLFDGIMLIILGIMGEYIGRIYDEIKNRPLYIVSKKVGFEHDRQREAPERTTVEAR